MNKKSSSQLLLGIVILAVGIGYLLDTLNLLNFGSFLAQWWPLLIILVGFVSLVSNPKVFTWPLFIILFGGLLQLQRLDIVSFNVWNILWPSAIILVGLSFIFDRFSPKAKLSTEENIDMFVAFSGIESINKSSDFQGGKITSLFGGISLDLRHAKIKKEARLEIFTAFGGVDLQVPEGWVVHTSGLPLFGGWDDKTKKTADENAPVLHIQGTCLFGGVDIKN